MKTDRRQELRTNELSQQIEQVGAYAKKNAAWLTAIIVGATVIVGGSYWYVQHKTKVRLTAWAALSKAGVETETGAPSFSAYESVIKQDLSPSLTAEALFQTANTAMSKFIAPEPLAEAAAKAGSTDSQDWLAKAEEAYSEVLRRSPDDMSATGSAMIALGVLSENRKEPARAREWYKKVLDDQRFVSSAFAELAKNRLAGLDQRASVVDFPPPLHTVPMPPPSAGMPPDLDFIRPMPSASPFAPASSTPSPVQFNVTPAGARPAPAGEAGAAPPSSTPPAATNPPPAEGSPVEPATPPAQPGSAPPPAQPEQPAPPPEGGNPPPNG